MGRIKKSEGVGVIREFKCRSCKMLWLTYLENNDPCSSVDKLHNFDFAKPIYVTETGG